ncbi:hypothetical protein DXG01_012903 [Tephrocybe rancida]|nr:hypothetical protein DXG01_012903 [Tephrocybe rancida]
MVISTIQIGIGWRILVEAFVDHADVPGASTAYFNTLPMTPLQVISKVLIIFNSIFADMVLIWRLYVVWGGNWYVCVPPALLVIAYAAVYLIAVSMLSSLRGPSILVLSTYMIIALAMSAFTHVAVTTFITIRIWRTSRNYQGICAGLSAGRWRVMLMIVESGAIYSTTVVLLVAFAFYKSAIGGILSDVLVQISAIIPTLIIVRARLGLSACGVGTKAASSVTSICFDPNCPPGIADVETASSHSDHTLENHHTQTMRREEDTIADKV